MIFLTQTKHDLPRAAVIAFDTLGTEQQNVPQVLHRLHTALQRERERGSRMQFCCRRTGLRHLEGCFSQMLRRRAPRARGLEQKFRQPHLCARPGVCASAWRAGWCCLHGSVAVLGTLLEVFQHLDRHNGFTCKLLLRKCVLRTASLGI